MKKIDKIIAVSHGMTTTQLAKKIVELERGKAVIVGLDTGAEEDKTVRTVYCKNGDKAVIISSKQINRGDDGE